MTDPAYRALSARDLPALCARGRLDPERIRRMQAVAAVLPFRVNAYVVDELIDWSAVPDDPIFQLTFPQPEMLEPHLVDELIAVRDEPARTAELVAAIRAGLNPHPGGQLTHNVPQAAGDELPGMQHKYRHTVLFFPSAGQTCHAFCSYCFRWPQFVGDTRLRFGARDTDALVAYLAEHPEVTDVLITGGDPMVMRSSVLERVIAPLLDPALTTLQTIRIGTKSLTYWPHRYLGPEGDATLRLFERAIAAGRRLAVMAHVTHPRELEPAPIAQAVGRVRATGATIHCQAPIIAHVNDDAAAWAELWRRELALGCVPYYMFVERDTGPRRYFEVPLARSHQVFRDAYAASAGLARTARGPVMSALPGKLALDGIAEVAGEQAFVLRYLQARDEALVGQPLFAHYDPAATWFDQLVGCDARSAALLAGRRPGIPHCEPLAA